MLGATGTLFIFLFFPWFSYTAVLGFFGPTAGALSDAWMYLVLLLCLGVIGYLFSRALGMNLEVPAQHWQILAGATGLSALLSLLALVAPPAGAGVDWGAIIGILAALTAVGAAVAESGLVKVETKTAVVAQGIGPGMATVAPPVPDQPTMSALVAPVPGPVSDPVGLGWTEEAEDGAPGIVESPPITPSLEADSGRDCLSCGRPNPAEGRFCRGCGTALTATAGPES